MYYLLCLGRGGRCRGDPLGAHVLRGTERQNQREDEGKDQQAEAEAAAFAVSLCLTEAEHDGVNDVYHRDAEQQEFNAVAVYDFNKGVKVVNGNDAFPAGFAR